MRHLARNASLILVLVIIAIWAIIPPEKKLRKGRDLAGGVSVVYQVDIKPGEQSKETLDKVIQVVKERLDPNGLLEISIVAEGNDRIDISMPLPSPEVKKLSATFESELNKLSAAAVEPDELERVLALPADQRTPALHRLAGEDATRLKLFDEAAAAHDAAQAASIPYEKQKDVAKAAKDRLAGAEATPDSVGGEDFLNILRTGVRAEEDRLDEAADALAKAQLAYEKARDEALASAVSPNEMRRVLKLSKEPIRVKGEEKGKLEEFPSPRQEALDQLVTRHKGAEAQIKRVVAAWEQYESRQSTLSDPSDLIRLLKGAGVLNFRIVVPPRSYPDEARLREQFHKFGPASAQSEAVHWYKINKIQNWYESANALRFLRENPPAYFQSRGLVGEMYDGEYYILLWDRPGLRLTEEDGQWSLAHAGPGQDQLGRPAISFAMDRDGATRMGALTEANVGSRMSILLDDEVYTAPNINSRIAGSGIIEGNFDNKELNYIIRVLSAGSLQAKLGKEPISSSVLAPELGADNLQKGLIACSIAFVACSVFMVCYYFSCGSIAVLAMLFNALLLVGVMAIQNAAFSLPGIAGVVLTFGQAVDSNVLIYERMREEFHRGADMRTAVRQAFHRALPPIVDGNISNLIICVVLGFFGTQEIRGFAITLGIGVITTLFSSLFFTRFIFTVLIEKLGWHKTSQLPMVFPFVQRLMTPHVDWMKHRRLLLGLLIAFLVVSAGIIVQRGPNLLGMEFRGGTAITLTFKQNVGPDGKPVQMKLGRPEVEKRVRAIAAAAPAGSPLKRLDDAQVVAVNPDADNVTSGTFTVKSLASDPDALQSALVVAFSDVLETRPPSKFVGSDLPTTSGAPVYPVVVPVLGDSIGRPAVRESTGEFVGGAAIVLEDLSPPPSRADLEARLERTRERPSFQDTAQHLRRVLVLEGSDAAVKTAVVVVKDPGSSFSDDQKGWQSRLADREWTLVKVALTETQTLANVQSFSPAIARTFAAQGVVCIIFSLLLLTIYVFVRFGTLRWAIAATVPLFADVIGIVGLIGIAQILHNSPQTHALARSVGLLPFDLDLAQIAAILTIVGYSLNDKIIILDRIRENKGKLPYASYNVINDSINQTLSRTVITAGAHMITTIVLYLFGGEAVRGFAYTFNLGVLLGTYTSIVSTPLVWSGKFGAGPTDRHPTSAREDGQVSLPGSNGEAATWSADEVGSAGGAGSS